MAVHGWLAKHWSFCREALPGTPTEQGESTPFIGVFSGIISFFWGTIIPKKQLKLEFLLGFQDQY